MTSISSQPSRPRQAEAPTKANWSRVRGHGLRGSFAPVVGSFLVSLPPQSPSLEPFRNEVELLAKLRGRPRIIHLLDWDPQPFPAHGKYLHLIMELGELDFNKFLHQQKQLLQREGRYNEAVRGRAQAARAERGKRGNGVTKVSLLQLVTVW